MLCSSQLGTDRCCLQLCRVLRMARIPKQAHSSSSAHGKHFIIMARFPKNPGPIPKEETPWRGLLLQVLWRRMCTCRWCLVLGASLLWWGWRRLVCSSCHRWGLAPQGMQVGALCTSNVYIHSGVALIDVCHRKRARLLRVCWARGRTAGRAHVTLLPPLVGLFVLLCAAPQETEQQMRELAGQLSMHAAGMNTQHVSTGCIPAEALASVRQDFASQTEALMPGKPAQVLAKIVDGKVAKWLKEVRRVRVGRSPQQPGA